MKRQVIGFWVAGAVAVVLTGGCANKEVVKSDEPLKPTVAPTQPAPAKPAAKLGAMAENSGGKQAAVSSSDSAAKPSGAESLKAALEKIYFDFDSASLSEKSRTSLTSNAAYLKKYPAVKITIEGNCDERGSGEYNLALGEKRAKAAARYLTSIGVAEDRIATISYGKEKPADPGHDEAAWAKNRRDEFVLQSK